MNTATSTRISAKTEALAKSASRNLVSSGSATRQMGMTHSATPVFTSTAGLRANRNRLLINLG